MAKQTSKSQTKSSQIKSQSAGAYFTAIVNKEKYTIKPSPEERVKVKKEIESYNLKPTDNRLKTILSLLKPKETKKKEEVLILKKQIKNKEKENKKALPEKQKAISDVVSTVSQIVEKEEVKPQEVQQVADKIEKVKETTPTQGRSWSGERYR